MLYEDDCEYQSHITKLKRQNLLSLVVIEMNPTMEWPSKKLNDNVIVHGVIVQTLNIGRL